MSTVPERRAPARPSPRWRRPAPASAALAAGAPSAAAAAAPRTSLLAVAALVLSLCGTVWAGSLPAMLVGAVALAEIHRSEGRLRGRALAWTALAIASVTAARLAGLLLAGTAGA